MKVEGTDFELEADLVLLAMGFVGPEREGLLTDLGVELTDRGNVARGADFATSVPGVFVAGDMGRGQSLIVWAIAEGRAAAAGGRPLPDGSDRAAGADQADRGAAALDRASRRKSTRHAAQSGTFASADLTGRSFANRRSGLIVGTTSVTSVSIKTSDD